MPAHSSGFAPGSFKHEKGLELQTQIDIFAATVVKFQFVQPVAIQ